MNMPAPRMELAHGREPVRAITRAELKGLVQRWRKRCEKDGKRIRSLAAYESLARAMGYPNWMRLSIDLNMHRVQQTYAEVAALFPGGPP